MQLLSSFPFLLLVGCVSAPIAPNLKLPEQKSCPSVALPPIPEHVKLVINGDLVEADQGGEQVLRGYVQSRRIFQLGGAK